VIGLVSHSIGLGFEEVDASVSEMNLFSLAQMPVMLTRSLLEASNNYKVSSFRIHINCFQDNLNENLCSK
jgi:hypothetical protein